jgi:hypothetical protein
MFVYTQIHSAESNILSIVTQSAEILQFMLIASKTLENMEGAIRNGQSIDTGSIAQKDACEEFRCSGDANMQVFAHKIYGDFVAFNAPNEV